MIHEFHCTLLREKYVIADRPDAPSAVPASKPIRAVSNRINVELRESRPGTARENFVVRAQNMHCCVRMTAKIVNAFSLNGPLLHRVAPFDWASAWESIVSEYEYVYNPQRWVAVYYNGRVIFQAGKRNPFLDVIEQCAAVSKNDYEKSLALAQDVLRQAGKEAAVIDYDGNIALVADFAGNQARCANLLRGSERTSTFNFSANYGNRLVNISQCLHVAAAYLEGIQLSYLVGVNNERMRQHIIWRKSEDGQKTEAARKRLEHLSAEIAEMESSCEAHYRPDKPIFARLIDDAQQLTRKILVNLPEVETD